MQPDLVYFDRHAAERIRPREQVRFAPSLAIEVLSPSTTTIDRGRKRDMLATYAVPEYWIVDIDSRTVEVSILSGDHYARPQMVRGGRYESAAQFGLAIDIEPLFAGIE